MNDLRQMTAVWDRAATCDPTLQLHPRGRAALSHRLLRPTHYTRPRLFAHMMRGRIVVFDDFPVRFVGGRGTGDRRQQLAREIATGFPREQLARIQYGPARTRRRVSVPELIRRWNNPSGIVSTTDLHFRKTRFARRLEVEPLSDFNVLCADPGRSFALEMMTLVVSSANNVTESHSDDSDGSNHCLLGAKLWLAWDRREGRARGLEDVTVDRIFDRATFDMETFLSLPSARWFVVSEGRTLFLPGNFTHKVVTLEDYVGVGSFHVSLPAYVRTLARWVLYETTDVTDRVLSEINAVAIAHLGALRKASAATRRRWGFEYVPQALREWRRERTKSEQVILSAHPDFGSFLASTGALR